MITKKNNFNQMIKVKTNIETKAIAKDKNKFIQIVTINKCNKI